MYDVLFDRLKEKRFLFQEVYYQQARPSMTGQAAVGRSVFLFDFVISSLISFANNSLFTFAFPLFDKKYFCILDV